MIYKNNIKPLFDFLVAFFGLLLLSPIFLVLVLGLSIANRGVPFFFQWRPGKDERLFKIIKFKTMNDRRDQAGNLLPDSDRLTTIGSFIRKTSLDEIPQLLNILKGQMSLVGPRPLLPQYLPLYSDFQRQRHQVKPGITGWAQVNGRNNISWEHKFELDCYYVKNISFGLDLKILLLTLKKVLASAGVSAQGQATTEIFKGDDDIETYSLMGNYLTKRRGL